MNIDLDLVALLIPIVTIISVVIYFIYTISMKDILKPSKYIIDQKDGKALTAMACVTNLICAFSSYYILTMFQWVIFPIVIDTNKYVVFHIAFVILPFILLMVFFVFTNHILKSKKDKIFRSKFSYESSEKIYNFYGDLSRFVLVLVGIYFGILLFFVLNVNIPIKSIIISNSNFDGTSRNIILNIKNIDRKNEDNSKRVNIKTSLPDIIFSGIWVGLLYVVTMATSGNLYTCGLIYRFIKYNFYINNNIIEGYLVCEDTEFYMIRPQNNSMLFIGKSEIKKMEVVNEKNARQRFTEKIQLINNLVIEFCKANSTDSVDMVELSEYLVKKKIYGRNAEKHILNDIKQIQKLKLIDKRYTLRIRKKGLKKVYEFELTNKA